MAVWLPSAQTRCFGKSLARGEGAIDSDHSWSDVGPSVTLSSSSFTPEMVSIMYHHHAVSSNPIGNVCSFYRLDTWGGSAAMMWSRLKESRRSIV